MRRRELGKICLGAPVTPNVPGFFLPSRGGLAIPVTAPTFLPHLPLPCTVLFVVVIYNYHDVHQNQLIVPASITIFIVSLLSLYYWDMLRLEPFASTMNIIRLTAQTRSYSQMIGLRYTNRIHPLLRSLPYNTG